jgi:hypothetical protein
MTGSSGHSPAAEIVRDVLVVCPQERDLRMIEAAGLEGSYRVRVVGEDPDLPGFDPGLVLEQAMAVPADGVIGTKDRSALLAAVIAERRGLPGPTVQALFACQHKPTSRRLQREVVPDATPKFELVTGPALPFPPPLFVKPVVGRLSQSARRVDSADDLPEPGENDEYAAGYRAVAKLAGLADDFQGFLAEELLEGDEVTLEGYVHRSRVTVIGVTDSLKYAGTNSFEGFVYPSSLPRRCLEEIESVASRLLPALEFDGGFFNVEFFVPKRGPAKVIEVNGRIASQFAPLVQALHGRSTYDALFALASGDDPAWAREEPVGVSLSYVVRRFEDAFVESVPDPGPGIEVLVRPGALLSEQHATNDPASYRLAILYQTGVDRDAALARARERAAALPFRLVQAPSR